MLALPRYTNNFQSGQPAMVAVARENLAVPPQAKTNGSANNIRQTTSVAKTPNVLLPVDLSSAEGKFGWAPFGNRSIPFLMRSDEKYVSLPILQHQLSSYLVCFTEEVYQCLNMLMYNTTETEAALLNEINMIHNDRGFGQETFTTSHSLVTLRDAINLAGFLVFCYDKLIMRSRNRCQLCGFIRINFQNYIPYVWHNSKQYVPLFYFDGECKYLEERSVQLTGWELTYLKLCCKIQGINKSQFDKKFITVVDMELVKKFFLPGTPFEDSWPTETKVDSLVMPVSNVPTTKINPSVKPTKTTKPKPQHTAAQNRPPPPYRPTKKSSHTVHHKPVPATNPVETNLIKEAQDSLASRLHQIPESPCPDGSRPFSLLKARLGNQHLNRCINLMAYDHSILLVTIEEAVDVLKIPMNLFVSALNYVNFTVYFPNKYQKRVLITHKIYPTVGLIRVDTLKSCISNIRNICFSLSINR